MVVQGLITFIAAVAVTFIITPIVIDIAYQLGIVDRPESRRVHKKIMPRAGGLSIIFGFSVAFIIAAQFVDLSFGILAAGFIVGLTGFLDDKFQLGPLSKIAGQLAGVTILVASGTHIDFLTVPFTDTFIAIPLWISIPITFIWVIGVTNAVNLIDGLDGLASGVSMIASITILIMAVIMGNIVVIFLATALIGSILGFLYFNFHPAKIFMGDTGSLFLGFILAVISLMGFKQVTTVSLFIPFIVLGVPLTDTFMAIIRRILNNQRITDADKSHLHHKLLDHGYSHTQTVFIIYGIAMLFGTTAVIFSQSNLFGATVISILLFVFIELLVERFSLINKTYRPLLNTAGKIIRYSVNRKSRL
ncbi:MAG TPA: MraY family glycosyltransferase [Bacillales bacterium]|nr:MraY family glycosyltransferase [Bacillales bacterium]